MRKKFIKLFKILLLSILALVAITVATLYFSLHEKLPEGKPGPEADKFALKILDAIKHDNYLNTDYLQWTFRNKNHYLWDKKSNTVTVKIDDHSVLLHLDSPEKNRVLSTMHLGDHKKKKIIEKALVNFNNDSFWLIAPHKLFDKGTIRKLVTLENDTKGLLVTYHLEELLPEIRTSGKLTRTIDLQVIKCGYQSFRLEGSKLPGKTG